MQPWSQPLLWKSTGGDPFWANVVLLMGFEGTNGSTGAPGMTDESPAVHGTATVTGINATIDTSQFKFGSSSLHVTAGNSSISFPDSNDWNFGAGQFTVECWIRSASISGSHFAVGQWDSPLASAAWVMWLNNATPSWNVSTTGTNNNFQLDSAPTTITANTWHHVAVDYDGTNYRYYLDGAWMKSSPTPLTIFNSTNKLVIGSTNTNNASWWDGWIDELRITKGVARYASNSGFAVQTAPFPRHA